MNKNTRISLNGVPHLNNAIKRTVTKLVTVFYILLNMVVRKAHR